jgi:hypothetical protein
MNELGGLGGLTTRAALSGEEPSCQDEEGIDEIVRI